MIRGRSLASLGMSLLFGACTSVARPDGGTGLLPKGAKAPEVVGKTSDGTPTALSSVHGHVAVVYFYPKDETPGCTREACAFRDVFAKYQSRQVTIFGVSRDSEQRHMEFRTKHQLPFPLVADENGSVSRAYGVPSLLGMTSRVTFLVGKDGTILRVWPNVDPGVHAEEVLAAIDAEDGTGRGAL